MRSPLCSDEESPSWEPSSMAVLMSMTLASPMNTSAPMSIRPV
jgi:hypothetical protein